MSLSMDKKDAEKSGVDPSSSRSTVVVQGAEGEKDDRSAIPTQEHGGEGESALPEDKRLEALERIEHDWAHDRANPRNWRFWKKWRMAGIVSHIPLAALVGADLMSRCRSTHLFLLCRAR